MKFKCMIVNDTEDVKLVSIPKHNHFYFEAVPGEQTEVTEIISARFECEAEQKYIKNLKKKGYGYLLNMFPVLIEEVK